VSSWAPRRRTRGWFGRKRWAKPHLGRGHPRLDSWYREPLPDAIGESPQHPGAGCAGSSVSGRTHPRQHLGHLRGFGCVPWLSPGVAPDGDDARSRPPQPHRDDTSGSARGAPLLRVGRGAQDPLVLEHPRLLQARRQQSFLSTARNRPDRRSRPLSRARRSDTPTHSRTLPD
jgi:hypothetical protein